MIMEVDANEIKVGDHILVTAKVCRTMFLGQGKYRIWLEIPKVPVVIETNDSTTFDVSTTQIKLK